jgi:hypothetical protein
LFLQLLLPFCFVIPQRSGVAILYPAKLRHPERSAAESKDPDMASTTHAAQTFLSTGPARLRLLLQLPLQLQLQLLLLFLHLGIPRLQPWVSQPYKMQGALAPGVYLPVLVYI